jgi:hypothetical protein
MVPTLQLRLLRRPEWKHRNCKLQVHHISSQRGLHFGILTGPNMSLYGAGLGTSQIHETEYDSSGCQQGGSGPAPVKNNSRFGCADYCFHCISFKRQRYLQPFGADRGNAHWVRRYYLHRFSIGPE